MRRVGLVVLLLVAATLLASCAPNAAAPDGDAGFWLGLWHGFTSLFTFVISLFNKNVGIYEVRNAGAWYDFGYVIGVMTFWGGGGGGAARGSKR